MENKYRFVKDEIDEDMVRMYVKDPRAWYHVGTMHVDVLGDMLSEDQINFLTEDEDICLWGKFTINQIGE